MDMDGSRSGPRNAFNLPPVSVGMATLDHSRRMDRRLVAEEAPVALVFDGTTVAVVMATPADLSDLAVGFGLTEGIIRSSNEISDLDIVVGTEGIELRIWLAPERGRKLKARQRRLVGPTGCGLCGIASLREAARSNPKLVRKTSLTSRQVEDAVEALSAAQVLNRTTRATHAAGFYAAGEGLMLIREDVGRHNALDKLVGALVEENLAGTMGAIILTSRISVEMVQKAAAIGTAIVVAISAPTALAVRTAETCGMTLVGIARGAAFEIFSHPQGIAA
jgi:FdhD protein